MIINAVDKFNQHLSSRGDVYLHSELVAFRKELQQLENGGLIDDDETAKFYRRLNTLKIYRTNNGVYRSYGPLPKLVG